MTVKVTKPALNLREELSSLNKPSGVAGEAMLRAETPQEQFNLIGAGRKNLIINGAMQVAQRGTSLSGPQNYTLDRWKSLRYAAGNYTVSQQSSGLGEFDKCVRVQRNSGDTSGNAIAINQPVEILNSKHTKDQNVTLSFYVRVGNDFSGQSDFKAFISYCTNSSDTSMNYDQFTSGGGVAKAEAMVTSTEWTKMVVTASIPANANQLGVSFKANSFTGTAGSNDYYEVTGVQLELGSVATPFEHRSYGEELALCQRYYQDLVPTTSSNGTYLSSHEYVGASNCRLHVPFKQTMRTTPSISSAGWSDATPSVQGITANGVDFYASSYFRLFVDTSATKYIRADAEL